MCEQRLRRVTPANAPSPRRPSAGAAPLALLVLGALVSPARTVAAERSGADRDKTGDHLFRATPPALLREFSTDRPDQTESPYTLDAGHFQIELDFVNVTLDRDRVGDRDVQTELWNIMPVNLKAGLLHNLDLQIVLDPYVHARARDHRAGTTSTADGFGDLQTRLKINLWGNDGGPTALALMPFVKWPLEQSDLRNGRTEGGLIVPLGVPLGERWGLGLMTEVDFVDDGAGGHDTEFVNSITVGHSLTEKAGVYLEFFTVASSAGVAWQGQVDVGCTYALRDNIQLDAGCNFGVTESAPDYQPFIGLSLRY